MSSYSEIESLNKILIHSPDSGIAKVTPDLATELLYEDIVYYRKMKEEHLALKRILQAYVGNNNCLEVEVLFEEVLMNATIRIEFIHSLLALEGKPFLENKLKDMSPQRLAQYSIEGSISDAVLPIPNFIFSRDIGSVAGSFLIHATAAKKARSRESLIMWFVFHHHNQFQSWASTGNIISPANSIDELLTFLKSDHTKPQLEGGDIMMMAPNHLLVGCSERTNERGIALLRKKIEDSKNNEIKYLSIAYLPESRHCMHWDTVFTFTNYNEAVGYFPLLNDSQSLTVKTIHLKENKEEKFKSFTAYTQHFFPSLSVIPSGNGVYPHDQREQWTDGCNFVALKPGLLIGYERNEKTLEAFVNRGYAIIEAENVLLNKVNIHSLEKTIITLQSSELSRARGGPHCLTFPLHRA